MAERIAMRKLRGQNEDVVDVRRRLRRRRRRREGTRLRHSKRRDVDETGSAWPCGVRGDEEAENRRTIEFFGIKHDADVQGEK